jgi:hypothetical protein
MPRLLNAIDRKFGHSADQMILPEASLFVEVAAF